MRVAAEQLLAQQPQQQQPCRVVRRPSTVGSDDVRSSARTLMHSARTDAMDPRRWLDQELERAELLLGDFDDPQQDEQELMAALNDDLPRIIVDLARNEFVRAPLVFCPRDC